MIYASLQLNLSAFALTRLLIFHNFIQLMVILLVYLFVFSSNMSPIFYYLLKFLLNVMNFLFLSLIELQSDREYSLKYFMEKILSNVNLMT